MTCRVLVAEPERIAGELIATVLTRDGLSVTLAREGAQMVERLREQTYDLVLCAVQLAELNGQNLLRLAKEGNNSCRTVLLGAPSVSDAQADDPIDLRLPRPFRYHALKPELVRWGLLAAPDTAVPAPVTATAAALALAPAPVPSLEAIEPQTLTADNTPLAAPHASAPPVSPVASVGPPELSLDDLLGGGPSSKPHAPIELAPAREPLAAGVAASGDLAVHPLGRVLFELYVGTFTGVLRLRRLGCRRSIYIDGGLPIHVESDQMAESLGRLLLAHGRITQDGYNAAQALVDEQQCRFGDALSELGIIGRGDLLDALMEQTEIKLANSFAWRSGNYDIEPLSEIPHHVVATEVHPLKAIWRGVSENYDAAALLALFAGMRSQFAVPTKLFQVHYDTLGPFLRELDLPRQLDGQRTFAALLDGPPSDRQRQLSQALYVLLTADMIRASEHASGAAVPQSTMPATSAAPVMSAANVAALARIAEEIAREYLRIKDGDYFDALRVELNATPSEIDAAYTNATRPWRPQDLPPGLSTETLARVREVAELLARARNTLRDPILRERYVASQRQGTSARIVGTPPPAAPTATPVVRTPFGRSLELDTDAERRQQSSQAARAHNEGLALLGAGNLPSAESKLREATRLAPQEPDYWVGLAQVSLERLMGGDASARQQAASDLQQAFQLDPAHIGANLGMAKLLMAVQQTARAKPYLERVLQRAPEHQEARRLIGRV